MLVAGLQLLAESLATGSALDRLSTRARTTMPLRIAQRSAPSWIGSPQHSFTLPETPRGAKALGWTISVALSRDEA